MNDDLDLIYFLVYIPKTNRQTICIIDLQRDMSYEKNDWDLVNDKEFSNFKDALSHASDLCQRHDKGYQAFESRYSSFRENSYIY